MLFLKLKREIAQTSLKGPRNRAPCPTHVTTNRGAGRRTGVKASLSYRGTSLKTTSQNKKQSSKSKLWIWLRGKGISLPNLITFSPQSTQDKKWGLTPTSDSRNSPWHKFVYIHTGTHIINSLIKLINKLKTKQLWSGIFKKQLTFSKYKVREKLKQGEYFYWVNNSSIKGNSFIMKFFQIYHYDSAFQMVKYYLF